MRQRETLCSLLQIPILPLRLLDAPFLVLVLREPFRYELAIHNGLPLRYQHVRMDATRLVLEESRQENPQALSSQRRKIHQNVDDESHGRSILLLGKQL